jgi:hypothetical protein
MRDVAPDGTHTEWLQDLINKTRPNTIDSARMVPIFNGTQVLLALEFQVNAGGAIAIGFTTDSRFAAALQMQLQKWCGAN